MFKGKHVVIGVVVLLLLFGGTRYLSVFKEKQTLKADVETYLFEQGYDQQDIQFNYIVNKGSYFPIYMAAVTFTDEPGVEYYYGYKEEKIRQLDAINTNKDKMFKHLEEGT